MSDKYLKDYTYGAGAWSLLIFLSANAIPALAQQAQAASPAVAKVAATSEIPPAATDLANARPRDIDRFHVDRVNLASDTPPYASFYIWRASNEPLTGKKDTGGIVPVCRWDEMRREMVPFASLPVGTEVRLDFVRDYFYHHYYRVVLGQDAHGQDNEGWIDGAHVARDEQDPRNYHPVREKKRLPFPKH